MEWKSGERATKFQTRWSTAHTGDYAKTVSSLHRSVWWCQKNADYVSSVITERCRFATVFFVSKCHQRNNTTNRCQFFHFPATIYCTFHLELYFQLFFSYFSTFSFVNSQLFLSIFVCFLFFLSGAVEAIRTHSTAIFEEQFHLTGINYFRILTFKSKSVLQLYRNYVYWTPWIAWFLNINR